MIKLLYKTEKSLKKQAYILFTGRAISFCINLLTPIILVRILLKSDYGVYRFAMLLSLTLMPIITLSINSSLYYFFPIDEQNNKKLVRQTFTFLIIIATALLLLCFVIAELSLKYEYIKNPINYYYPIAIFIYFLVISSTIRHLFILEKKAIFNALFLIIEQIVRTIFLLSTAFFFRTAYYALWGLVGYAIARTIFLIIYLKLNYNGTLIKLDNNIILQQLKYSLPFVGSNSIGEIGRKIDRFAVTALHGMEKFSIYSIATFKAPLLGMFYQSMFQIIVPKLSTLSSTKDIRKAKQLWHNVIVKAAMVTVPLVIFLEIMAAPIITILFTKEFLTSVAPYRIFLIMPIFQMTGYGLISRAFNKTAIYFKASLASLVFGIVFSIVFTIFYGIIGAAISALLSFGVNVCIIINEDRKVLKLNFRNFLPFNDLFKILFFSLACAILIIVISFYLKGISEFIVVPICLTIYTSSIVTIYYFNSYIKLNINDFIKSKLRIRI